MKKNFLFILLVTSIMNIVAIYFIYKISTFKGIVSEKHYLLPMNSNYIEYVQGDKQENEKEKMEDSQETPLNASIRDIFLRCLIGEYVVAENIFYKFDDNGQFFGFFDAEESNVYDYSYEVVVIDELPYVNIYNKEKTKMVSYELQLSDKMNVILCYEKNNLRIELKR